MPRQRSSDAKCVAISARRGRWRPTAEGSQPDRTPETSPPGRVRAPTHVAAASRPRSVRRRVDARRKPRFAGLHSSAVSASIAKLAFARATAGPRSMQSEHAVDRADLRRPVRRRVRHHYGMQRAIQRSSPECQKILQDGKVRPSVVLLPHIRLQQPRVIRPPIENMRSSQSETCKLATATFRDHLWFSITRRRDSDDSLPPNRLSFVAHSRTLTRSMLHQFQKLLPQRRGTSADQPSIGAELLG
jgi:hypothetical protein